MTYEVREGPLIVGNIKRHAGSLCIPTGKWAVVIVTDYAGGGVGPSLAVNKLFPSREAAEIALKDE